MRLVNLLHHSSRETGEVAQIVLQNGFAEVTVFKDAVDRVG
jgi:hypothetical protein